MSEVDGVFMKHALYRDYALTVVGFSLCWQFFPTALFSKAFIYYSDSVDAYLKSFIAILILLVFLGILVVIFRRRLEVFCSVHRGALFIMLMASPIGYLLLIGAPLLSVFSSVVHWTGIVLVASGYLMLILIWLDSLAQMTGKTPFLIIVFSFFISSFVPMIAYLPGPVVLICLPLIPLVSSLCWYLTDVSSRQGSDCSWHVLAKFPLDLIGLFALFIYGGRFVVGFLLRFNGVVSISERVVTLVLAMVILVQIIVVLYRSKECNRIISSIWTPAAILFMAGLFIIIPFSAEWSHIGISVIVAELSCFEILLYIVLLLMIRTTHSSSLLVFGLAFVLLKVVPTLMQRLLVPYLAEAIDLADYNYSTMLIVAVDLVVISGAFLYFNHQTMRRAYLLNYNSEITKEYICQVIGEESSLSKRETEILTMMAQGNSLKRISETLFLAPGTIQGYSKTLYRKLGIHSKQDLIDLVTDRYEKERAD